jgi:hypothetical protein
MNTVFLLMAQFGARAVIPIEEVRREYFSHLELDNFLRKIAMGDIALPLVRMEKSQKSAKGIYVQDLADYIDARRAEAQRECDQLRGYAAGFCGGFDPRSHLIRLALATNQPQSEQRKRSDLVCRHEL